MVNGTPGWKGYYLSAYGLAVKRGYPGTEEEWLDSLHGANVEMRYENGELQWKHDTSEEWHTLEEFTALRELLETQGKAAEDAAKLAEEKAQAVQTVAALANTAAQNAELAAGEAVEAKGKAEAAERTANIPAERANREAERANAATQSAQESREAADAAAEQANAAAQSAQESKEVANTAAEMAQETASAAQTQGEYAKAQGDRAVQLISELENTDVSSVMTEVAALQSGKADLIEGKVPAEQLSDVSKQFCTFVIGTSTAGWTETDCDYLCDGVDDQEEINAAIQTLPGTGGEILILSGAYNITSTIQLSSPKQVTMRGNGCSSQLNLKFDGPLIRVTSGSSNSKICDLMLVSKRSQYPAGVGITGHLILDSVFQNIQFREFHKALEGAFGWNVICNNVFVSCDAGFDLYNGYVNTISNNIFDYSGSSTTRELDSVISGNVFMSSSLRVGGEDQIVTGNYIQASKETDCPVEISGTRCVILGNVVHPKTKYLNTYAIDITSAGKQNMVAYNAAFGGSINNRGGSTNTIIGNKTE